MVDHHYNTSPNTPTRQYLWNVVIGKNKIWPPMHVGVLAPHVQAAVVRVFAHFF